ncbi:MAG: sigma-70 family RNA polymerase sigma factor [Anaerolineales bacterium]|nr:sigma-70 family RNA polymerase sigma factor [Anaerolineales bacterium]
MAKLEILIERWRAGDERAAEAIYNLHRERTFRLAYALLSNTEDAEEAAQDALAYALLKIDHFDEKRSQFTTWLHMITVSRSRDVLRKRRFPAYSLIELLRRRKSPPDPGPGPERQTEKTEMRNAVWEAVQKLNPMQREVIVLRHWGGHTYQEISEIVGCPMKTAQSRVRLAYQKLARTLEENDLHRILEETR